MNFNNKKILIAPHTPRSTMFKKDILNSYPNVEFLGYIDKVKEDNNIFKIEKISHLNYDYILILSQNHFNSIYDDYIKHANKSKLIKIDIHNNNYVFYNKYDILYHKIKKIPEDIKLSFFKLCVRIYDKMPQKRNKIVFLSKSFISTNNKMLFVNCINNNINAVMLTDNAIQLKDLKKLNLKTISLDSLKAYLALASAKIVIQDQGNSNYLLHYLNKKQLTIQLWHGIPLKKLNLISDIVYDYYIGTSSYVNNSSMNSVIQAKNYLDYGYPRTDLLLQKHHSSLDLLFYDKNIYEYSKEFKTIVYMPTHRESSTTIDKQKNKLIPLDFKKLNTLMIELNSYFIIKLHPFVMQFYEDIKNSDEYTNILFHSIQGDVYPTLKYTDILITDYSSVYFDFLFVNKPIVFFDYDKEEYEKNIGGFTYNYDDVTPGEKAKTQEDLMLTIKNILEGEDKFKKDRSKVKNKFFTYCDENSSQRLFKRLLMTKEKSL